MAKVLFKRIEDSGNINNIEIEDGSFIVTGDGKTYVDYGEDRIPTSGTPDTEMSDRSRNTVENNVIKEYVDNNVLDIYSTSEVKTNKVWTDGRSLYRVVLYVSSYTGGSSTPLETYDLPSGCLTSEIKFISGGGFNTSDGNYLPINYTNASGTGKIICGVQSTNKIWLQGTYSMRDVNIEILYTKPTN
jgi:hypothetical protein